MNSVRHEEAKDDDEVAKPVRISVAKPEGSYKVETPRLRKKKSDKDSQSIPRTSYREDIHFTHSEEST